MKRKIISVVLSLALVLSMIPAMSVTAFAGDDSFNDTFLDVLFTYYADGDDNTFSTDNNTRYDAYVINQDTAQALTKEANTVNCDKLAEWLKNDFDTNKDLLLAETSKKQLLFDPTFSTDGKFDYNVNPNAYNGTNCHESNALAVIFYENETSGVRAFKIIGVCVDPDSYYCYIFADNGIECSHTDWIKIVKPTYSAFGNKITVKYTDADNKAQTATLKLTAKNLPYTGKEYKGAALSSNTWKKAGLELPTIMYKGRQGTFCSASETAPTRIGKYTAYVVVDGKYVASADFEIMTKAAYQKQMKKQAAVKNIIKKTSLIKSNISKFLLGISPFCKTGCNLWKYKKCVVNPGADEEEEYTVSLNSDNFSGDIISTPELPAKVKNGGTVNFTFKLDFQGGFSLELLCNDEDRIELYNDGVKDTAESDYSHFTISDINWDSNTSTITFTVSNITSDFTLCFYSRC